jgi:glycosyltransferase involved in cell wall biosynthesis
MGKLKTYFEGVLPKFEKKVTGTETMNNKKTKAILLIDSPGLSHYTSYLAYGLSKYRDIILYGFSSEEYYVTGAATQKRIKFYNIREKLPNESSTLKIIVEPLLLFFILFKAFTKSGYDIVHIQGYVPMFFFFIPMLKLRRKKIFWTIHDVNFRATNAGIRGKLDFIYTVTVSEPSLLEKYADMIIVHGCLLKNQLIAKGTNDKKIEVIPHCDYRYLLNNNKEQGNTKLSEANLPKDYALFFGRIAPYKGLELLVNASRIVKKKKGHEFILLIAGEGDISLLKNHMSDDDYAYIYILNKRVPYQEIPHLFNGEKFLILPYVDASQSGVIPLAYTFSKPVIVSNVGSLSEYVEHGKTGLIFEPSNAEQLSNYIVDLFKNRELCTEMGINANRKLLNEMSLELCCARLNHLYNTI